MTHPSSNLYPSPDVFPGVDLTPPISATGMTLQDGQNELAGRGFDYLSPSRMTIMLNDAKNAFEDVWEFPWLQRLISAQVPVALTDLKYVVTVKTSNSYCVPCDNNELLPIDVRQLAQGSTNLSQAGPPAYWYLIGGVDDEATMYAWPVSDTTLQIFYIAQSPELVDPTDRPIIPPRYRSIWIDLAVIQAYQDSDNFQAAQALQADVNTRLNAVIERYETVNRQMGSFIGQRGFSEDD